MNSSFQRSLLATALIVICCYAAVNACAQSVGTVVGTVTDPTGAVIPGATVTLTSAISGYRQTTTTDARGFYRFANVPFSPFTLHAEAPGFNHVDQTAELRTNVPLLLNVQLPVAQAKQEVTVTEQAPILETTSASTHRDLDYEQLDKMPVAQPSRAMSAIVESVPGVVQDDNGRMHARGSESQVQYVVDGVPITENLSGIFSTALDTSTLRSSEIVTGNVPAEYGDKLSAVVNINTKSGLEMPWSGAWSLGGGSFGTGITGAEFGGHIRNFGVFVSADANRTERYLDPPEIRDFHNIGGSARFFTRFDWAPSPKDNLRLSLSANGSDVQVPNRFEQQLAGQRQRQELRDDSESLGWNHVIDNRTVLDVALFRRSSTTRLLDPEVTGFPFFAEQRRRQRNEGVRANLSREWKGNSFKTGFEVHRLPLSEFFVVAATDPAVLSDPTNPARAFTIANAFVFQDKATGKTASFYLQDRVTFGGRLTADVGVRLDHYRIVTHENAASPRVGLAYYLKRTGTVLRASYNRLFQTPPTENLLLSSSPAGAVFSPIASSVVARAVPPEKTNFYELGAQQQMGRYIRLDVSHYVKNAKNFSDKDQFLDTGIIFPIAVARGDVRGTEARLDLAAVHGVTAFISYANSKTVSTTPIVGGLFLEDEASELLVPGIQFLGDHDERNTGQFGITYTHRTGSWISFDGRYDSGVPSEFNPAILPRLDARIRENLDPVRGRVKPRAIFDLATGLELFRETRYPVSVQVGVDNLFNRFYLYNFQSVFSGTHVGRPREITARLVFHWKSQTKAVSAD